MKASGNKVNPEDSSTLQLVYELMSKNEFDEYGEDKANIHWLGRTFDHAPLVGALASLSSLQNDVLQARDVGVLEVHAPAQGGRCNFNGVQGRLELVHQHGHEL